MGTQESFQDICIRTLKESGSRLTKARIALIECLSESKVPLSPKEILERAEKSLDKSESMDTVTVYRILDKLYELGLVHRVAPGGDYIACTHLSCQSMPHIMTHCVSCQKTNEIHVPEDILSPLMWFMKTQKKFEPKKHLFQLDGLCERCSQQR
jgi:Fe2+ or Zn2+ uptake regulation protein